jgi:hypothetical protein
MPAAVVPAPPWWTTARQDGKTAAWFTAPTTFTWPKFGTWAKSLAPEQINARSPNCVQAALMTATVTSDSTRTLLPKPK